MEPILAASEWCKMETTDTTEVSAQSIEPSIKVEKEVPANPSGEHLITHEPIYESLNVKSNLKMPTQTNNESTDTTEFSAQSIEPSIKVEKEVPTNPTAEHLITHEPIYESLNVKSNLRVPTQTDNESSVCHIRLPSHYFKCEFCEKAYKIRTALNYHMHRVHTNERLLLCDLCHKPFENKQALFRHVQHHAGMCLHQCDLCHKTFNTKTALFRHLQTHSNSRVKCNICGKFYTYKTALNHHIRRIHQGKRRFACDVCNESFSQESDLDQHKLSHVETFSCEIRQTTYKQKRFLDNHMLTHSDATNFKCKYCNSIFTTTPAFIRHIQNRHQSDRRFRCVGCKKVFCQKSTLKRHMKKHANEKHFQCRICRNRFKTTNTLNRHMLIYHPEVRHIKCELCAISFKTEALLNMHVRSVHSANTWVDSEPQSTADCPQRVESDAQAQPRTQLRNQSKICFLPDQSDRPYRCDGCGKRFVTKSVFRKHMLTAHSGMNCKCELCDTPFKTRKAFNVHNRIVHTAKNTGEKSEPKITLDRPSISRGKRKLKCEVCDKAFTHRAGLKSHNRAAHPADTGVKCEPK